MMKWSSQVDFFKIRNRLINLATTKKVARTNERVVTTRTVSLRECSSIAAMEKLSR